MNHLTIRRIGTLVFLLGAICLTFFINHGNWQIKFAAMAVNIYLGGLLYELELVSKQEETITKELKERIEGKN